MDAAESTVARHCLFTEPDIGSQHGEQRMSPTSTKKKNAAQKPAKAALPRVAFIGNGIQARTMLLPQHSSAHNPTIEIGYEELPPDLPPELPKDE